jgi:hypothetical protein
MADSFIQRFLDDPSSREAREWLLSGEDNTLGELEFNDESIALVEEAYAAGAHKVIAVEIDKYEDVPLQNTGKLVIELPSEPAKRVTAFAWAGKIAESQGFEAEEDEGQSHVFLMLD